MVMTNKKLFFAFILLMTGAIFFTKTSIPEIITSFMTPRQERLSNGPDMDDFSQMSNGENVERNRQHEPSQLKQRRTYDDRPASKEHQKIAKTQFDSKEIKKRVRVPDKQDSSKENNDIETAVRAEWNALIRGINKISSPKRTQKHQPQIVVRRRETKVSGRAILKRLLTIGNDQLFVGHSSPCPYMGLLKTKRPQNDNASCVAHKPEPEACKLAARAYRLEKPLSCAEEIKKAFCVFQETWRSSKEMRTTLKCDISACGTNPVHAMAIDPSYGIIEASDKWFKFKSAEELEKFMPDFVIKTTQNGLNFCFLRCDDPEGKGKRIIKQILTFPPVMSNLGITANRNHFNFNILVLDSVSRAHFYRSLPKTVSAMRKIANDPKRKVAMLDFELLQSTAPGTYHNINAFMSGKQNFDDDTAENTDQKYEIDLLYDLLKSRGYYTMLQQDSCWYDERGSIFTSNVFRNNTPTSWEEFAQRFEVFSEQVSMYGIHDFGLTHTACEVFKQFGTTNQFGKPRRVCYGGKVYAEYYLEYTTKLFRAYRESGGGNGPVFAFTHLGMGHEVTGTRIRQIDSGLARYVDSMAKQSDTLTMIFSDHGPKATKYSLYSLEGRAEIYDALLFMIVPEKVVESLGMQRTRALISNQHRLITTLDLHKAIVSILIEQNSNLQNGGVFSEIPENRTCAHIPMKPSAICKCEDWEQHFTNNHEAFTWLAELGLGEINNAIQTRFLAGSAESTGGYGKCQRLVGYSFEKIRRRKDKSHYFVTMDVTVRPEMAIFEVQFKYPHQFRVHRSSVEITSLRRVSMFQRYAGCVDAGVPLDMCVCDSKKTTKRQDSWKWSAVTSGNAILEIINRSHMFDVKTSVKNLHDVCLLLLTRKHNDRTVAFEIANSCADRKYKIRMTGRSKGVSVTSRGLPLSLSIEPLTIHFLFSVYHVKRPYGFHLKTSYTAYMK